ncbi:MAG: PEGA domain-containing protein [Betaproteobacteria bacterium]|nr:PEGA domain-containing protein [Betaproteobacteria bacterium]
MNAMLDQGNRTFIGSVVFIDIVGYSKKSVSEQISMKDRFTGLLTDSLKDIGPEQRIILDTGDGAALSFLGDPEDALFVGMHMRDMLKQMLAETDQTAPMTELALRIGINLGPVKLIRDINGHPNIVGDGINVAQRIMSFAKPGQIVVSRSFFDVVSVISDEYGKLFKYEGSRTDKHVREHEIYVVGESAAAFKQAKDGMVDRAASTSPRTPAPAREAAAESTSGGGLLEILQDRKKLTLIGGGLGALVLVLFIAVLMKKPAEVKVAEAPKLVTPAVAEAPKVEPAAAPAGEAPKSAETTPQNAASPVTTPAVAATPEKGAPPKPEAAKPDPGKVDAAKADPPKPVIVQGVVSFSIQPWGDVFVNGKAIGASPPLKQTRLNPGKYKIEVRNSTFSPHIVNVEVKAKEEVSIKHKFQ